MRKKPIQLLAAGGIDTGTNPKLVQPPAVLELENLNEPRTGEFAPRNGFTKVSVGARSFSVGQNLYQTPSGGIGTIARGYAGVTEGAQLLKYGNAVVADVGWEQADPGGGDPISLVTARVSSVPATSAGAITPDAVDPDVCVTTGYRMITWGESTTIRRDVRETISGKPPIAGRFASALSAMANNTAPKTAGVPNGNIAIVWGTGAGLLRGQCYDGSGTAVGAIFNIAADLDVGTPAPWFDIKPIPGTNNIAVAYKNNAAGVTCGIYNPAAGTFTSVVVTAAADASMCLGWLDDTIPTTSMFLATAGAGPGVVVRTMSAATMVVSATNVIDAGATAGVRNITGYLINATPHYVVLWDIAGASSIHDYIRRGIWTGAATLQTVMGAHSLYSRAWKFPDGSYYVLASRTSTVQATYTLLVLDRPNGTTTTTAPPACAVLSGEGGGRRYQSSLASPTTTGSNVLIPVARARRVTTPSGASAVQPKAISLLTFSVATKLTRARELGGTVFVPGGMIRRDDNATVSPATFPIYPEACTGTSAVGGAMTAGGSYSYRAAWKLTDAMGRISWSAASVPFSITLGGGDGQVNLLVDNYLVPRLGIAESAAIVLFRRGPAASGATLYNKVSETPSSLGASTSTVAVNDSMSDANAALGEAAYFNGNILENFHPPGHTLLEVNGNRVGIVNAEDPTEFWFSKEYKAGTGIAFNPQFKVQISGDGAGGMTALAAMDGRWILFKGKAIYVLSGDGPNDLGQGSYNQPQAVSRTLGTINPSSIIETPDGIMFQAHDSVIWLLDRGLSLTPIGSPVEQYTIAEQVVGAAIGSGLSYAGATLVSGTSAVRFVMASGRMLEWDFLLKRWRTHQLKIDRSGAGSTIVDCANSPLYGWCYLLANGDMMQEVDAAPTDTNGNSTAIIPRVSFPHLQLGGLAGYQRFYGIDFVIEILGNCTVAVDAEFDQSGALTGTPRTLALTSGAAVQRVEYLPPEGKGKCTSVRPVITVSGTPAGLTWRLTGATAWIGVKRGTIVPAGNRLQ